MFGDKSGAAVHWKFLPLLRNFGGIIQFSWGSTCLAHLYRSLCRATRVDCKKIDGPLTLLLTWAWIRLPFLAPIPGNPRLFPIANRWRDWERENYGYRYTSLENYRRLLDDLQEGQFVWQPYGIGDIDPDLVPLAIRHNLGVPTLVQDLGASHGEILTGPKNQDWANTHFSWVMQWTNRYSHILSDDLVPLHYQLESYMDWYRRAYGDHLQLSNLVFQENPEGPQPPPAPEPEPEPEPAPSPPPPLVPPQHGVDYRPAYVPDTHPSDYFSSSVPVHSQYWGGTQYEYGEHTSFSQLLGLMASGPHHSYSGSHADIPTDHPAHPGMITPGRRSLDSRPRVRTSSENSGARMSVDSSRSAEGVGGIIQSENPRRIPMSLIHESNMAVDDETDNYLVDDPEDEDEDEDEDELNAVDDDPAPSAGTTTSEKGKGYNLRADPPRRSANRYTPSAFNKIAKKCKKLYKDMKWGPRK
ncbi:hypothetical protein Ahy_A01g004542 [Arachis hypogaea]|uniref:Aminotransferase-like plant mobile domain-containing protein n=1 Tax=Arachis hypogaea TaxID=3818 RepID=A0A445EWD6_ARAHY|nr:hypothetical protein Ahy_A01g004542 [Arachis hypogaea]